MSLKPCRVNTSARTAPPPPPDIRKVSRRSGGFLPPPAAAKPLVCEAGPGEDLNPRDLGGRHPGVRHRPAIPPTNKDASGHLLVTSPSPPATPQIYSNTRTATPPSPPSPPPESSEGCVRDSGVANGSSLIVDPPRADRCVGVGPTGQKLIKKTNKHKYTYIYIYKEFSDLNKVVFKCGSWWRFVTVFVTPCHVVDTV